MVATGTISLKKTVPDCQPLPANTVPVAPALLKAARAAWPGMKHPERDLPWATWLPGVWQADIITAIQESQNGAVEYPIRWITARLEAIRAEHARARYHARKIINELEKQPQKIATDKHG